MKASFLLGALASLLLCSIAGPQVAVGTPELTAAPQPAAVMPEQGPYRVHSEPAWGAPNFRVFRPENLSRFPRRDTLPVVVWGNGGCIYDTPVYSAFLLTVASHGFLVITTAATSGKSALSREATADDLGAAISWAERENNRAGSPLKGKIAARQVAVMGQSCGGSLAIQLGADPRVSTIGVFDYGSPDGDALKRLRGPVLLISGGATDFMQVPSKATYDAIDNLPVFYGSLHGADHTGTVMQPGGGEFAKIASDWVLWRLKGDKRASRTFVGTRCALCTKSNWDTAAKQM